MFEQFPSPEPKKDPAITKEQVIEAFKNFGNESEKAREVFVEWTQQKNNEIEKIADYREATHANLEFNIERLNLFIELGLYEIALEEINGDENTTGLLEFAEQANEEDLFNIIFDLRDDIIIKMNYNGAE